MPSRWPSERSQSAGVKVGGSSMRAAKVGSLGGLKSLPPVLSQVMKPNFCSSGIKFSAEEIKLLVRDMMPELQKFGFMTWLNTGGKDFNPPKLPTFAARIDDPPTFTPTDWDRSEAHRDGMPMPPNKHAKLPSQPPNHSPRTLT